MNKATIIKTLEELLDLLYPILDPNNLWNPSILTLNDVLQRYSTKEEMEPALSKSSEISHIHSNVLGGLCDFHIGIIYIYWDNIHLATDRFESAGRLWRRERLIDAESLTFFATGCIHECKLNYIKAMNDYNGMTPLNRGGLAPLFHQR